MVSQVYNYPFKGFPRPATSAPPSATSQFITMPPATPAANRETRRRQALKQAITPISVRIYRPLMPRTFKTARVYRAWTSCRLMIHRIYRAQMQKTSKTARDYRVLTDCRFTIARVYRVLTDADGC